jgi:SAM-dependent methyltransferase
MVKLGSLIDLNSFGRCLDYGCGKGFDADHYNFKKYDPHFFPKKPVGRFDLVVCNYVLNVIEEKYEEELLDELRSYLRPHGMCYVSVRADVKKDGFTSRGTFQRTVELDYPIVCQLKNRYIIYKIA